MKRSFVPVLMLALCAAIALIGCESAIDPATETAALNTGRSAAADSADIEPIAVSVTGPVVVIDGKAAVAYQGIPYYVNGGGPLTEGSTVTVSGDAAPIIEWDAAGNSLFYGYSVKEAKVTVSG